MKKLLLIVAFLIAAALLWQFQLRGESAPAPSVGQTNLGRAAPALPNSDKADTSLSVGATRPTRTPGDTPTANDDAIIKRYSDWNAQSAEDARWLQRHGFPDDDQAARLFRMTDAAVEALAEQGDPFAQIEASIRRLRTTGGQEPVDELLKQAANGSNYALERLGMEYTGLDRGKRFLGTAYFEASRRRGNWAAPLAGHRNIVDQALTAYEQNLAMQYSELVILRLAALRAKQGLAPLPVESRPGVADGFAASYEFYLVLRETQGNPEPERVPPSSQLPVP